METTSTKPTPMVSIRRYCMWCTKNQFEEIRECPSTECPLWGFRLSKKPDGSKSSLKTVRAKCLDCVGGNANAVNDCKETECSIHCYRFGKNLDRQRRVITDEQREALRVSFRNNVLDKI